MFIFLHCPHCDSGICPDIAQAWQSSHNRSQLPVHLIYSSFLHLFISCHPFTAQKLFHFGKRWKSERTSQGKRWKSEGTNQGSEKDSQGFPKADFSSNFFVFFWSLWLCVVMKQTCSTSEWAISAVLDICVIIDACGTYILILISVDKLF